MIGHRQRNSGGQIGFEQPLHVLRVRALSGQDRVDAKSPA
jgi:hypothetical protein